MIQSSFDNEMQIGRAALGAGDYRTAGRHFGRAHDLGREAHVQHFAAHRALLSTAWAQKNYPQALVQLIRVALAAVTGR